MSTTGRAPQSLKVPVSAAPRAAAYLAGVAGGEVVRRRERVRLQLGVRARRRQPMRRDRPDDPGLPRHGRAACRRPRDPIRLGARCRVGCAVPPGLLLRGRPDLPGRAARRAPCPAREASLSRARTRRGCSSPPAATSLGRAPSFARRPCVRQRVLVSLLLRHSVRRRRVASHGRWTRLFVCLFDRLIVVFVCLPTRKSEPPIVLIGLLIAIIGTRQSR